VDRSDRREERLVSQDVTVTDLARAIPQELLDRILNHLDTTTFPTDPFRPVEGPCWIWRGGKFPAGYGSISYRDHTYQVHRLTFVAFNGPFPADRPWADHVCRVRACCNPVHVEAVTAEENQVRARRPYCKWGHAFTPENTGAVTGEPGQRVCRACSRAKAERYRARRGAA
jgi:HNH endonuclease